MGTMNISLPDDMKAWVDQEVQAKGYMSASEYIRDLIRHQKDVARLRDLIDEGMSSPEPATSTSEFFAELRAEIGKGQ